MSEVLTGQGFRNTVSYPALSRRWITINHVYSTSFSGDSFIPAGTYIGFEDLAHGGDRDYNDEEFVISFVPEVVPDIVGVPEPSTLALIGVALLSLVGAGVVRRRADA